jgi:DNA-binding HxlR family transcriptional regulator
VRGYHQFCPAASALDVVGERWTLLVIRELLVGPKRYTDLQEGLPGIGPNVLAARLRSLESAGLIEKRRLPPPAASTVYELTELGVGLRPVMAELFRWGLRVIGAPSGHDALKASWWLPAIQAGARAQALPADVDDVYEIRVGDEIITVMAKGARIDVREGPSESPDVVLGTDHETFIELGRGRISATEAVESGRLTVEGDPAAAERCAALFGLSQADGAPAAR